MRIRMFQPQFAPLVRSGAKRQTVRATPKRMPRPGDRESWRRWTGLPYRSKTKELAKVQLTGVWKIKISAKDIKFKMPGEWRSEKSVYVLNEFAKTDGFKNFRSMLIWFRLVHGLPFTGICIQAKDV